MSAELVKSWEHKIHCRGPWATVREMRNKGVPFEQAYFVFFGRLPRV